MTISKELLLAILSMDSYNRGYGAGVNSDGESVGDAHLSIDSEAVFKDPEAAPEESSPAKTAGFYALAYSIDATGPEDLANKTVLAYRGTDNPSTSYDADYGGSAITQVQGLCRVACRKRAGCWLIGAMTPIGLEKR
ncbi:hypothetical protein [Sinirhodobacter huangdaonensis]|uniref:Uncharacterized protein n=1 Tax=Paenirhodobacter huangdaonensis TaxID=2501515 RepID=A0A443LSR0_9RHOB|nr:hypothetical protein [Sinirhodobacter huangdaonensis]RWR52218.1 hypothetical protein EOW66_10700 [Sinirhodobacter huangdaonensis]